MPTAGQGVTKKGKRQLHNGKRIVYAASGECDCCENEHTGACCTGTGASATCAVLSEADCEDASGDYKGNDVPCEDVNCDDTKGACCTVPASGAGSDCSLTTAAECTAANGDFKGLETACATAGCTVYGSCCYTDGSGDHCETKTQTECDALSGDWNGTLPCSDRFCACPSGAPQTVTRAAVATRDPFTTSDASVIGPPPDTSYIWTSASGGPDGQLHAGQTGSGSASWDVSIPKLQATGAATVQDLDTGIGGFQLHLNHNTQVLTIQISTSEGLGSAVYTESQQAYMSWFENVSITLNCNLVQTKHDATTVERVYNHSASWSFDGLVFDISTGTYNPVPYSGSGSVTQTVLTPATCSGNIKYFGGLVSYKDNPGTKTYDFNMSLTKN